MYIQELLKIGIKKLQDEGIIESTSKARILLSFVLGVQKEYLIINSNEIVDIEKREEYLKDIEKLASGIPLQHITNKQEFMKLDFYVDARVLIPRPDTEILVEEVIELIKENDAACILDLCTGSGCIGVSIAKYTDNIKVYASDISGAALEVAKKNASSCDVDDKIEFIESDMFDNIGEMKFDIIVSNPPYVQTGVINSLNRDVMHDPWTALDGGIDGLDFYRIIINNSYKYLKNHGLLCLEIGYDQKDSIIRIIEKENKYDKIYCKQDLYGNNRVLVCRYMGDE